jgi:hypothetical protein
VNVRITRNGVESDEFPIQRKEGAQAEIKTLEKDAGKSREDNAGDVDHPQAPDNKPSASGRPRAVFGLLEPLGVFGMVLLAASLALLIYLGRRISQRLSAGKRS